MALQQVMRSLQRLNLASTLQHSTPASSRPTIPSLFHTSAVCQRVLNRRLYPISLYPSKKGRWVETKPIREENEYTVSPLPLPKSGGRGPNGRIWNWRRGGGNKRNYRMVDYVRQSQAQVSPSGTQEELVHKIMYDPNRSANIALVAHGNHKRYIIATQNMKEGDVIKTSIELTESAIRAAEGDAHPLGSLAVGTLVSNLELFPGEGAKAARAAGAQAQILRKTDDRVVLRLPSKREVSLDQKCVVTVGRVGNIAHNQRVVGKAGRNRWRGLRPRSGFYQKKTGRFGKKMRADKPLKVVRGPQQKKSRMHPVPYAMTPLSERKYRSQNKRI